jgi:HipA-like protein
MSNIGNVDSITNVVNVKVFDSLMPRSGNIIGVDVFLEKTKRRTYVGRLSRANNLYAFNYDDHYLHATHSIPLGPDIPLTKKIHHSSYLFKTLQDRIPDRENPAYAEYCTSALITPAETDKFVLLTTIGRRGPSSFIFEPVYVEFTAQKSKQLRKDLGLTIQDFAALFDMSESLVYKIEAGRLIGTNELAKLKIYVEMPMAILYKVAANRGIMNDERCKMVIENLEGIVLSDYLVARHAPRELHEWINDKQIFFIYDEECLQLLRLGETRLMKKFKAEILPLDAFIQSKYFRDNFGYENVLCEVGFNSDNFDVKIVDAAGGNVIARLGLPQIKILGSGD